MNSFDEYDDKVNILFEIQGHGKKTILINTYDDSVAWAEIVDDVVRAMESSWGYSFNVSDRHDLGIYYPGKEDGSS